MKKCIEATIYGKNGRNTVYFVVISEFDCYKRKINVYIVSNLLHIQIRHPHQEGFVTILFSNVP